MVAHPYLLLLRARGGPSSLRMSYPYVAISSSLDLGDCSSSMYLSWSHLFSCSFQTFFLSACISLLRSDSFSGVSALLQTKRGHHQRQLDIINCGRGLRSMIDRGLIEGADIGQLIANLLELLKPTVLKYWKNNPEEVATPQKKRKKKPTPRVSIKAIDDFDRGVIRRAIHGMYDRDDHVTFRVNPGPGTASIFQGGRTTLYKLHHEIGFSWQKTNRRKVLMEDVNVAAKRIAFLREYRKLAAENINFVEKLPTKSWRKDEYAARFTKHDIKFDSSAVKMELMSKALAHKPEKR
uniref:Uncharacterized protein n=1 Tax=Timema monikensis TaxID=170555 RepID=A0A7R9EJ17_9NEOP|nr:unnamed protein product [Timema monikensis]